MGCGHGRHRDGLFTAHKLKDEDARNPGTSRTFENFRVLQAC